MKPLIRMTVVLAVIMMSLPGYAAEEKNPAIAEVEGIVKEAAQLEKKDDCEGSYLKYSEGAEKIAGLADRKSVELSSIISNKIDKLKDCYNACQPSEREKGVVISARDMNSQGQVKRAAQMLRRLLVGKNEKCRFWASTREFFKTLPPQVEIEGKYDPCDVSPEVKKTMEEAREAVKREREEFAKLEKLKGKLPSNKLADLITLFRQMDSTRSQLFKFREDYLDCEEVYKPLSEDSTVMRDTMAQTQDVLVGAYKGQISSLNKKIGDYKNKLKERDAMLEVQGAELDKLKKQFDDLSAINEDIFNDLFNLVGIESINFSNPVEGQKIDQPLQNLQELLSNEGKVVKAIQDKYPEYFKDGVNVEGLKRRKFVMEKLQMMMQKFGKVKGTALGYDRTMAELDTTIKMMDKTIAANEGKTSGGSLSTVWFILIVIGAIIATAIIVRVTAGRRRYPGA